MARRISKIDRLGPEVRDAIGRLLDEGSTLDEILGHLEGMSVEVSRSSLGRYSKRLATAGEKLRRSRSVAEALVRKYGDQPESKAARLNIELLHGVILDLFMADDGDEEGSDAAGRAALKGNPQGAMMLAKALEHLTKASRHDVEFIERAEKRAAAKATQDAAAVVEKVGKAKGLTAETLSAIKEGIFGVKAA
ncbi:DUF3486 family protein [Falsiroseomonas sp.]|uniref:DUF3486 family protein n=1 Tax=Falsiroseomonas sp. TaxID=2870721 RepID=UPI00271D0932|nr:DUF3486 family protein [Falsiroseomonas sp.]MDO9499025.1 DUF3486 family protein [Falsiroseomonas sp.]